MSTGNCTYILLGSCFSQHMSQQMAQRNIMHVSNPLGTLFNPESIRIVVSQALKAGNEALPMFHDKDMNEWRCWWANTLFRDTERAVCEARIRAALDQLGQSLRLASHLFLTLGTNVCYRLKESGITVTNCQRQADRLFQEYRLSTQEIIDILEDCIETLHQANPSLKITFTISPYRYRKYGYHGSQLSKAALLLAVDSICSRHDGYVGYFPSYEIMMDELRDYSYYAPDGLHPSPKASDIIWNRLCEYLQ